MLFEIASSLTWLVSVAGILLFAFGLIPRPRGPKSLCPGTNRAWWRVALNVKRWFIRGACGYDLAGLGASHDGSVRCPECGCLVARRRYTRKRVPVRFWALGLLLLALGSAPIVLISVRGGSLARALPTLALAAAEAMPADRVPRALQDEMDRRIVNGLASVNARMVSEALSRQLRDDEIEGNAQRSIGRLDSLWPDSRLTLEACLHSRDQQVRAYSADVLRRRLPDAPSKQLVRVSLECLRSDSDLNWRIRIDDAGNAAEYVARHATFAQDELADALGSSDPLQRFAAAAIGARAGLVSVSDAAIAILIEHLGDNSISRDAEIAEMALYSYHEAALPALEAASMDPDSQRARKARWLVTAIKEDIEVRGTPEGMWRYPRHDDYFLRIINPLQWAGAPAP